MRAATFGTECGATLKIRSGVSHREAADTYAGIHGIESCRSHHGRGAEPHDLGLILIGRCCAGLT
jgi:hypothetical protein